MPDGGEKCCGIQYDDDILREYAIFHVVQFNIGFSTLNDFVLCSILLIFSHKMYALTVQIRAFTSGRRAQNESSEWNGQKSNIVVNL